MASIQTINQKYGVASENTVKALEQLYNNMESQKINLLNQTMALQQSFNEMWKQEIDIMEKQGTGIQTDRYKDYLDAYKVNPTLANAMYPDIANQVTASQQTRLNETPIETDIMSVY